MLEGHGFGDPSLASGKRKEKSLAHLFSVKVVFPGLLLSFFPLLAGTAFLGPAASG